MMIDRIETHPRRYLLSSTNI